MNLILIIPLIAGMTLLTEDGYADIFRFTDNRGTIHFVDDASKVPARFRQRPYRRITPAAAPGAETKVIIKDNRILVPVKVRSGDREAEILLLLDTGSTATAILPPAAKRLALEAPAGAQTRWEVVGGGKVTGTRVKLDSIHIGPHKRDNVDVDILPHDGDTLPYDGYLGMNFLSGVTYHIDTTRSVIRWLPAS